MVRVWVNHRERIVKAQKLLVKRVGADIARAAYEDRTPEQIMPAMPRRAVARADRNASADS